ncbi:MAG: hypothetical protein NVSMB17_11530 [Candidatus Dormibacteria bacterium]
MTGAMAPRADAGALSAAIADFTRAQSQRGVRAVALEVADRDGRPVVSGTVLTQRQAREVRDLARRHGVTAELVVASDPRSGMEEGWVEAAVPVLDLWREPSRSGEEMGRQTQYLASDGPFRSFGAEADHLLVQGPDLAMGWARSSALTPVTLAGDTHPWEHVARAQENVARKPRATGTATGREALLQRARRELGVAYVWGGTSHAGFDCSGLVQRVFLDSTGVLLPRHTGDQRRVGERVVAGGVRAGDLLFATPLGQKVGHVLLMTGAGTVLHACRTENRVMEESLVDNARRYQHQGWRRPVWLGEAPD